MPLSPNAQVLWALKLTPALRQDYFDRLDRFTGVAAPRPPGTGRSRADVKDGKER